MFRRKISHRLKIGRFLGIDLFIHWTFWLLILLVALSGLAEDQSWQTAGIAVLQILTLFLCVTLHEYGHALMARRFGIQTADITLLPIGGLARLERMPREPSQELLIAVAGPAVNVVIALLALIAVFFRFQNVQFDSLEYALQEIGEDPFGWLMIVNTVLVLFNMIPAFPMDGGRVLRAILAALLDYRRATRIAARIGLLMAIGMGTLGIYLHHAPMVLISAFIGYAGWVEARQVELLEAYRGIRIENAMVRPQEVILASDSLPMILDRFSRIDSAALPVVGVDNFFLGWIDLPAAVAAAEAMQWNLSAMDLADPQAPSLTFPGELSKQASALGGLEEPVAVVDDAGRLVGMLDPRWARLRSQLLHLREQTPTAASPVVPSGWTGDQYA